MTQTDMTQTDTRPAAAVPAAPPPGFTALRNAWRALTSMRTALVLLFLLAIAALPGALLPQRPLNSQLVEQYFTDNPALAPALDAVGAFDVFAAPWFAAIYLLLMVSLIGCVLPRTWDDAKQLRAEPVAVPRNLARLPHHDAGALDVDPATATAAVRAELRGWRIAERTEGDVRTISAEKGYLREVGNLVFHLSLVGLLVGFAAGKLFGYEGQVIVPEQGGQFCNTGILGFDSFRAGTLVDGTDLAPFCVRVDDVTADYLPTGQAETFATALGYQTSADLAAGRVDEWRSFPLGSNNPLRTDGVRVYMLGHGYAPVFTVTFPNGEQRTGDVQWRPVDTTTLLSEGATKFEPPGVTDDAQRRASQLAITGLLAPTTSGGEIVTSIFPEPRDPEVAVDVLRGDLGLDDGRGQSIFEVDRRQVEQGELVRVARVNLVPGQSTTLDDGTVVRFDGVRDWVNLQVSHDPGQVWVLVFSITMLGGLGASLAVRRRRFWARVTPTDRPGSALVELGGLARTDRAGYGEEFDRLAAGLLRPRETEPRRLGEES